MHKIVHREPRRLWQDESGQTLVLAAVCFAVLVAFLGLAVDVGHLRYAKHHLQLAADAAALASGLEMRVCGSATPCSAMASAVQSSLAENGFATASVVYNCATAGASPLVVMLNLPPCSLGASDMNQGRTGYLEVLLQQQVASYFARFDRIECHQCDRRANVNMQHHR